MVGGAPTPPQLPTAIGRAAPFAMGKLSLAGSELPTFPNDDEAGNDVDDRDWLPPSGSAWCGTRHGGSEAAC